MQIITIPLHPADRADFRQMWNVTAHYNDGIVVNFARNNEEHPLAIIVSLEDPVIKREIAAVSVAIGQPASIVRDELERHVADCGQAVLGRFTAEWNHTIKSDKNPANFIKVQWLAVATRWAKTRASARLAEVVTYSLALFLGDIAKERFSIVARPAIYSNPTAARHRVVVSTEGMNILLRICSSTDNHYREFMVEESLSPLITEFCNYQRRSDLTVKVYNHVLLNRAEIVNAIWSDLATRWAETGSLFNEGSYLNEETALIQGKWSSGVEISMDETFQLRHKLMDAVKAKFFEIVTIIIKEMRDVEHDNLPAVQ